MGESVWGLQTGAIKIQGKKCRVGEIKDILKSDFFVEGWLDILDGSVFPQFYELELSRAHDVSFRPCLFGYFGFLLLIKVTSQSVIQDLCSSS